MPYRKIFLPPLCALSLLGCQADNQDIGTIIGAIGGAALGNAIGGEGTGEVFAIAVGALAGAYIGGEIGKSLDQADRAAMQASTQQALEYGPSGESHSWINPDSGHSGTVTPEPAYEREPGQHCREYQQTVIIGGEEQQAYGTACRQPDGSWKIIESR